MNTAGQRQNTILVVDDETSVRSAVIGFLEDEDYRAIGASTGPDALATLDDQQIDLVLLDVWMKDMDGLEVLQALRQRWPELPVLMMSGHGSIDLAVRATREGAYDFLEKPLVPEKLAITISRALEHRTSLRTQEMLREDLVAGHQLIGESAPMEKLREEIGRVAASDGPGLIVGENGSGKELVARAIHEMSGRSAGPFVRLNSAAIPRDLVESELFGYEKGAFTGATARKRGKLELADRGTLFLDEVGDMDAAAQAKLLRALESGEVERLGGTNPVRFDVRVLAATNKDLKKEIHDGNFREDLYYRLAVIPLFVPPLRERGGDIVILAKHFVRHYCQEQARPVKEFSPEALNLLSAHRWTGNVRELRNLMERLAIMTEATRIDAPDLGPLLDLAVLPSSDSVESSGSLKQRLEQQEKQILLRELAATGWNVSESARRLGIDRASLHRKIRRYDLRKENHDGME